MLSVIMLSVIMPGVIMPSVIMPSVIMPSVIMLSVILLIVIMLSVVTLRASILNIPELSVVFLWLQKRNYAVHRYAECCNSEYLEYNKLSLLNHYYIRPIFDGTG
jgi:hypothetical protein